MVITRRSADDIDAMKRAGVILSGAMEEARRLLTPGVTTGEVDQAAEEFIYGRDAKPLFKGYRGFPAATCISVNEEVVHGIPGRRTLREGDIVSVDIGVEYEGWCADAARTFPVGEVSSKKQALIEAARGAFQAGVNALHPGMRLVDLSRTVQDYVESRGFSVVRQYVGHGIGREMHEDPQVPNFVDGTVRQATTVLPEGCVLAIEPMVNAGGWEVRTLANGWTVVTADGQPSAHWENTVAITNEGPVITTV